LILDFPFRSLKRLFSYLMRLLELFFCLIDSFTSLRQNVSMAVG
jgi:hypothetical protein